MADLQNPAKLVAFYLPELEAGGVERATLNIAAGVAARGWKVDLVVADAQGPYASEVPEVVRLVDLAAGRALRSLPGLIRYLMREKPDTLVLVKNYATIVGLWAAWIARSHARTVVVNHSVTSTESERDLASKSLNIRLTPYLTRLACGRADCIASVSRASAAEFAKAVGLPQERVRVVHNPVLTPDFLESLTENIEHPWFAGYGPPVILAVGRLSCEKDFRTLIRAFAMVRREMEARLVVIGEGPDEAGLRELSETLGLADDIDFLGYVPRPGPYMARSGVFVSSSRWENMPSVVIEALAAGTRVVATDCPGGIREILRDGIYDRLVPVGDERALADAIVRTLRSPKLEVPQEALRPYTLEAALEDYMSML